jgi:hypothetical protein
VFPGIEPTLDRLIRMAPAGSVPGAPSTGDVQHLRWDRAPDLIRPDYSRALTGVAPTVLSLLGRGSEGAPRLTPHLPRECPHRALKVFLLCLDGLGFKELGLSGRLRSLYGDFGTWVTSVFPSITSTALTSIYQGLPPSRHGILGHQIWKDFPGGVVDMLRMQVIGAKSSLAASGFDVNAWKREPGLLGGPLSEGLRSVQLMPQHIVGSGLSAYCYGDTKLVGFLEPLEGFAKAAHLLAEAGPGWVGLYLPSVDTLAHAFGGDVPPVGLALRHVEEGLTWMANALAPRVVDETALMVVTDHGQSTVNRKIRLEGDSWKWMEKHSRAIGFSGRVMHVYLGRDFAREADRVEAYLASMIGDLGYVFRYADVRELVGPDSDGSPADQAWVRQSLGELVAILRDGVNWDKPKKDHEEKPFPYGTPLVSHHGALSHDEMIVPLVVAPLAAVAGA